MKLRIVLAVICVLFSMALFGCGGGGGAIGGSRARERAIATTRNARTTFAVAGLGRTGAITRATRPKMGSRAQILLASLQRKRDVPQGYDEGTQLYYTVTLNSDGSGRQDLYTDAAHTDRAGDFIWNAHDASAPMTFKQNYRIAKGEFAGERGTLDVAFSDTTGNNGTIHIVNTNDKGENIDSTLQLADGKLTANGTIRTLDGDTWQEYDFVRDDGEMVCRFTFPDGTWGEMTAGEDGTGTSTYYGLDGDQDVWGDYDEEGMYDMTLENGTTETVDVDDWGDDWDVFWEDAAWDDWSYGWDDGADRHASVRKSHVKR